MSWEGGVKNVKVCEDLGIRYQLFKKKVVNLV